MANPTGAFGLRPVRYLNGNPYNGATVPCLCEDSYATALFIGDPVAVTTTTAERDTTLRYPTINKSAGTSGVIVLGAVVSFDPYPDNLSLNYRAASTTRIAHVAMGNDLVFEIRGDGGGTPTKNWIWNSAVMIATTAGSTTTGLSGMQLDEGTTTAPSSTQADPLIITGISSRSDNEIAASVIYEVILNTYHNTTGDRDGVVGA
jgi:hypothetical protein